MKTILPNVYLEKLSELEKIQRDNHKKIIALQAYKETCTDQKITIELMQAGIESIMHKYTHGYKLNAVELLTDLQTVLNLNTLNLSATDPRISSNPQY